MPSTTEEAEKKPAVAPLSSSEGQSGARQACAAQALESTLLGWELSWQQLPTDLLKNQRFGVRQQLELAVRMNGW